MTAIKESHVKESEHLHFRVADGVELKIKCSTLLILFYPRLNRRQHNRHHPTINWQIVWLRSRLYRKDSYQFTLSYIVSRNRRCGYGTFIHRLSVNSV